MAGLRSLVRHWCCVSTPTHFVTLPARKPLAVSNLAAGQSMVSAGKGVSGYPNPNVNFFGAVGGAAGG